MYSLEEHSQRMAPFNNSLILMYDIFVFNIEFSFYFGNRLSAMYAPQSLA